MPKVSFTNQARQLSQAADDVVAKGATQFYSDITKAWAVDTGQSRLAWQPPKKEKGGYVVSNPVNYSPILWRGRVPDENGIIRGSLQMPNGGVPIVNKAIVRIQQEIKKL